MDFVNRLIAWAAYITGAVPIGLGAFFAFHYYRGAVGRRRRAVASVAQGEDRPSAESRDGLPHAAVPP